MSDAQPPAGGAPPSQPPEKPDASSSADASSSSGGGAANTSDGDTKMAPPEPEEQALPDEILNASAEEITTRARLLENDIKVMRSEHVRLLHEQNAMKEKIKDNSDKVKQNKVLPYLVGNVVEVSGNEAHLPLGGIL